MLRAIEQLVLEKFGVIKPSPVQAVPPLEEEEDDVEEKRPKKAAK